MTALFGRDAEITAVTGVLDVAAARVAAPAEQRTLLICGEPGIGKTALLEAAVGQAGRLGLRVLRTTGVQSEADLPYAGLHQLFLPLLGELDRLEPDDRDALGAAFGFTDAEAGSPFRIAAAGLQLLGGSAAEQPVLIAVEDAHWLDGPTRDVLMFVLRQATHDDIAVLITTRETGGGAYGAGLPVLALGRLAPEAAAGLLDERTPGLPAEVRERLLGLADGLPLALRELPTAATDLPVPGAGPAVVTLTGRLEQIFAGRLAGLPPGARTYLLFAALDDGVRQDDLIAGRPVTAADLDAIVAARLATPGPGAVRWEHPLARSAVRQSAAPAERRAAHAALAAHLAGEPDRAVWHRAAAAIGPDEDLAEALAATAHRARRRGALAIAIAALEQAAVTGTDQTRRGDRLLTAVDFASNLGRMDLLGHLFEVAAGVDLDPATRNYFSWVEEAVGLRAWTGVERVPAFTAAVRDLRDAGQIDRALDHLFGFALRCWYSTMDDESRAELSTLAAELDPSLSEPRQLAVMAWCDPIRQAGTVRGRLAAVAAARAGDPEGLAHLVMAAAAVGDHPRAAELLELAYPGLRAQGRIGQLVETLGAAAWMYIQLGRPRDAEIVSDEAVRLGRASGQPRMIAIAALGTGAAAAQRGDEALAESVTAQMELVLAGPAIAHLRLVRATALLGAGRYPQAYEQLRTVFDPADPAYHPFIQHWLIGDWAETCRHLGRADEAWSTVAALTEVAGRTDSPGLDVNLVYARAILSDDEDADQVFGVALAGDLDAWPLLRARLLLAYGIRLRRRRRVTDARGRLRSALELFTAIGAAAWAGQTRRELVAAGVTVADPEPPAGAGLTAQETQIARLAAGGITNREIGRRLFLSHRTVGTHLHRIYFKLGVPNRTALADLLSRQG
ncbi:LuxR family transcriptional regulator [Actinoplanes sp. L3-i22]|uniref:helix-turn-helix transcriptional regulator n=1 Tax=Actinoplanes sp. L3-i22 TaxID=2836373 RepID=UPI001C861CCB|nr:LuxR family transcriptional regulator [Actinoplanes sp. L3-i22]